MQFFGVTGAQLCAQSQAPFTAGSIASEMSRETTDEATLATMTADSLTTSLLEVSLGVIDAVYDTTVTTVRQGTRIAVSTGYLGYVDYASYCASHATSCVGIGTVGPVSTDPGSAPGGTFVTNLEYVTDAALNYDCNNACGHNTYVVYKARGETEVDKDFWGVAMESSVGPGYRNGAHGITQINTFVESEANGVEVMSSAPRGFEDYGSAGSVTVSAGGSAQGASFGISRTWDRPKGKAGGAARSNRHTVAWKSLDGPRYEEKSLDGVNLWRATAGSRISFGIGAGVYYK